MPYRRWLQSLADMLSTFPNGQAPSQQLLADIQLVLDESIILVMAHGGQLPDFVTETSRLELVHKRLGESRLVELSSQPLSRVDIDALIPIVASVCRELDALKPDVVGSPNHQ
jgi:hypothetical protein